MGGDGVSTLLPGTVVRRKQDKSRWRVEAFDTAQGVYVLSPADEYGQNIAATADELRRWGTVAETPSNPDSATPWRRLADAFARAVEGSQRHRAELGPTPEAVIAAEVAGGKSAARQHAERIFADADKLGTYEVGLLPTHPDVRRALDVLIANRDKREAA
jgi:hypothetical protein